MERRCGGQDAEQAVAGGLLAAAAVQGLGALQVGHVDQHQAPVELLGGQRQPVELGQRVEQQAVGVERRGRGDGQRGGAEQPDPAIDGDGDEAGAVTVRLAGVEERRVPLRGGHPDHPVPGRQHPFFHVPGLSRGQEALGARARLHVVGDRGREVGDPGIDLPDQQPGRLGRGERGPGDGAELGVGEPLGDVHRRGAALLAGDTEDQPAGHGAQDLPEVRLRLVFGALGDEHVDRALHDVPQRLGIGEAHGPVAAADERLALRERDLPEPVDRLPLHVPRLAPCAPFSPIPRASGTARPRPASDPRGSPAAPRAPGRGPRSGRSRGWCSAGGPR